MVVFTDKNNDAVQARSKTGDHSDKIRLAFFFGFSGVDLYYRLYKVALTFKSDYL